METETILILTVAGVMNLLLLFLIINAATKASLRAKYEWAQMELLAKIAKAQGVPAEEVNNIISQIK